MATPCRQHLCPELVTSRAMQGYCDKHSELRGGWTRYAKQQGTNTERGYGYTWQKLRLRVLERDGYLCVTCTANSKHVQATDVDHIKPKAYGGTDDVSNLQALCGQCHNRKSSLERSY